MIELISFNVVLIISLISLYSLRKIDWLKSFHIIYLGLFLIILAGGLFVLNKSVNEINDFLERREWPVVAGEVTAVEMKGLKTHEPQIKYIYKVEKTVFSGSSNLGTPLFGGSKSQRRVAQTILASFTVGDTVKVFFNPKDYAHSVLRVTPNWSVFIQYSFSTMVTSLMLAFILIRFFKWKRKKIA